MYDDVRAHIQEMLDIGALCKLHSPWASAVVLVQKKGWWPEVLYLPQETKRMNYKGCLLTASGLMKHLIASKALSGSPPLDLKSGYWKVEHG